MFRSFLQAGFECTTGYNVYGDWIDQVHATEHDIQQDHDYALLASLGIRTIREGVRWPLVDNHGKYEFSTLLQTLELAEKHGIEVIHDLFHFGYPSYLDPFSSGFPEYFSEYCFAAAEIIQKYTNGKCFFTPVNEPSFFSWAGGEAGLFAPHVRGRGFDFKIQLIRAAICGIDAIFAACPDAVIVNADALCRVVEPLDRNDLSDDVQFFNQNAVFQAWDMLAGKSHPELGGSPKHLGVIGINYYWTNQWEIERNGFPLEDNDPRRWPLSRMINEVWERYRTDLLITETSHVGAKRETWLRELAGECEIVLRAGIPLHGVCIYPVLGMPEWHDPDRWTDMGLWDLQKSNPSLKRVPYAPALKVLPELSRLAEIRV